MRIILDLDFLFDFPFGEIGAILHCIWFKLAKKLGKFVKVLIRESLSKLTYLRWNNSCFRNVANRGEILQSGLLTSTQVIEQQLDKRINPNFMNVEPAAVIISAFIIFYRYLCAKKLSAVYSQTWFKKLHFRKKYMVSLWLVFKFDMNFWLFWLSCQKH